MKIKDVEIGMRVVPFKKTIMGGIETSVVWNQAMQNNQQYLYVINKENDYFALGDNKNDTDGDYFKAEEFHVYKTDESFPFVINSKVTEVANK